MAVTVEETEREEDVVGGFQGLVEALLGGR